MDTQDITNQYWITVGILFIIFCLICIIITIFKAIKERSSFFEYLREEDVHFTGVISWMGVFIIGVLLILKLIIFTHNLIF